MMKISFESTFTVLLESFVFNLNVKVSTVEGQICIAVLFEKKNYVMVLLLRKARQANFEKRQRVEKISQFRRITDLQNNLRKEMYELATIAHRQYSRSK